MLFSRAFIISAFAAFVSSQALPTSISPAQVRSLLLPPLLNSTLLITTPGNQSNKRSLRLPHIPNRATRLHRRRRRRRLCRSLRRPIRNRKRPRRLSPVRADRHRFAVLVFCPPDERPSVLFEREPGGD